MDCIFTQKVADIIHFSRKEANRLKSSCIGPEHFLLGILADKDNDAYRMLAREKVDMERLSEKLGSLLYQSEDSYIQPASVDFSLKATNVLKLSCIEAKEMKASEVTTIHLLLGILRENDNNASEMLKEFGIYYTLMKENIQISDGFQYDEEDDEDEGISRKDGRLQNPNQELNRAASQQTKQKKENSYLDSCSIDLTQAAADGKLDPVVGREKEIERVAQILSRRKKNNPVLIGDPGVGKSAIVEGLALRIAEKKISHILFNKRVLMLDMSSVVAGTKYRGQFEERIHNIINEVKENPDIILFIDEIHTIVGAGSAEGSMDAANILKPALSRGEIQCIGATTLDEYRKSIEKDGALERRFQKIIVSPTSADETLQILKNIKDKYEAHHNVRYTDKALEACVRLTERYVTDRKFPDKAIDALDEAGSRVHLSNFNVSKEIEDQEKLIAEIQQQKEDAAKNKNFELASSFRDKEVENLDKLEFMQKNWMVQQKENYKTVDESDIENVVSLVTGIPVQRMAKSENEKLKNMKEVLLQKVIAQDKAVDTVVKAIRRSRIGLKDPNKPIGTFLFMGPTGVGKTHLAKQLAVEMFGSTDALIRIDMSEYMEKHTVSRLIGAPPGYVGYEEGGQLTEKVRRKPYSIILLDEIEKSHPDVFNLLLQVMDEGRLTDNVGRTIDFKNTIIIMTSNVGTRQLKEYGKGIGFAAQMSADVDNERSRSVIAKALNKTFSPEFLNRLDEIITFDQLDIDALTKIVDIELDNFYSRVKGIGYKIHISDEAKRFVADKGYDVQFGARPLKRSIQNYLEDGLAELIINESPALGATIEVNCKKDKSALEFAIVEA